MFRPTSVLLTSLAALCLLQSASCQTAGGEESPPVTLYQNSPASLPHAISPARRWELAGHGDGVDHDFVYTSWAQAGEFELSVASRAQQWMSRVSVSLEDSAGNPLTRVMSRAGADQEVTQNAFYRLGQRQPLRVRVHVDANAGPYRVFVNGPLER